MNREKSPKHHEVLVDEGSNIFPYFLVGIGTVACVGIIMESYFQLTNQPFSFLRLFQKYGVLADYVESREPNRGIWHPVAWIGSAFFCIMMLYSVRKHLRIFQDFGPLRYWLDAHMFLGIVATFLVTAHTTYKIGGIVSLSFWSMILVAGSGVFGRYIYVQIPRNISGNALRMDDIRDIMEDINDRISKYAGKDHDIERYFEQISGPDMDVSKMNAIKVAFVMFANDISNFGRMFRIRKEIYSNPDLPPQVKKKLFKLIKEKGSLVRSVNFLATSERLLHYWHVFHKPFALIMFIIMFLHIGVYFLFRAHA